MVNIRQKFELTERTPQITQFVEKVLGAVLQLMTLS